jgi:hypothetical protein
MYASTMASLDWLFTQQQTYSYFNIFSSCSCSLDLLLLQQHQPAAASFACMQSNTSKEHLMSCGMPSGWLMMHLRCCFTSECQQVIIASINHSADKRIRVF